MPPDTQPVTLEAKPIINLGTNTTAGSGTAANLPGSGITSNQPTTTCLQQKLSMQTSVHVEALCSCVNKLHQPCKNKKHTKPLPPTQTHTHTSCLPDKAWQLQKHIKCHCKGNQDKASSNQGLWLSPESCSSLWFDGLDFLSGILARTTRELRLASRSSPGALSRSKISSRKDKTS